jgi:Ca2+-binding RTX toxin-like protein
MGGGGGRADILNVSNGSRRQRFSTDGDVQAVEVVGDRAYFAGHWTQRFGSYSSFHFVAVDIDDDNVDQSYYPRLTGLNGVHDLLHDGFHLWMGGDITDASPVRRRGYARYAPSDPLPCSIMGTSGDDVLEGTSRRDVICGLGGADIIYGKGGPDLLLGGSGADLLYGGSGDDTILGGTGLDKIYPGKGVDYVNGGSGSHDWVDYASANHRVVVSLRAGLATGQGPDTLVSVENVVGSAFNDKLIGNSRTNRIVAGAGADRVWGKQGDDFLWGKGGPDILYGGSGSDMTRGGSGTDTCTAERELSC